MKPVLELDLLNDSKKIKEEKEALENFIKDFINKKYPDSEAEKLYSLFTKEQVKVLKSYFKGFSVQQYKETCGTVHLQLKKKQEMRTKRLQNLMDRIGDINVKDWVYDGMADTKGLGVAGHCDLCDSDRDLRYVHYAANKKTHETLCFGSSCAAKFFNVDEGGISSLRTIQAKTLQDIKTVACVIENNLYEKYYTYLCGYIGDAYLKNGVDGLLELLTFVVNWDKNGELVGADTDKVLIRYGNGKEVEKSKDWVKEHIACCLNADLDGSLYTNIEERNIVKKNVKKEDIIKLDTFVYVDFAIKFLNVGLPIPPSIVDGVNKKITVSSSQHSPDKIKYIQELLMESTLSKSSLLTKAFTEFMINYLSYASIKTPKDPEMDYWGIRGQGTFYNTVLSWELALWKLDFIKEVKSLVSKGLITDDEIKKFSTRNLGFGVSEKLLNYAYRASDLFINKKPVIKDESNVANGFSKYMVKGIDDKISLLEMKESKSFNLQFTAGGIPYHIMLCYTMVEEGYKKILSNSIVAINRFLKPIQYIDNEKDMVKYLCLLMEDGTYGVTHRFLNYNLYDYTKTRTKEEFLDYLNTQTVDTELMNKVYAQYKGQFTSMKKDMLKLYNTLSELAAEVKSKPINYNLKKSEMNKDYDDLVVKKERTLKDCFMDYCGLLIAKRGTKKVQELVNKSNLYHLIAFRDLNKYEEIFRSIQDTYNDAKKKAEEHKLFEYFNLNIYKNRLEILKNAQNIDVFINAILYLIGVDNWRTSMLLVAGREYDTSLQTSIMDDVYSLQNEEIIEKLKGIVKEGLVDYCKENYLEYFKFLQKFVSDMFEKIDSDKMTFSYFVSLLKDNKKIKANLNDILTVNQLDTEVFNEYNVSAKYEVRVHKIDSFIKYSGIFDGSETYAYYLEVVKGCKEYIEKLKEIEKQKELENRSKDEKVNSVKTYLKEHILFFEVDVESLKNNYRGKSAESIRRSEAFKAVKYERSSEVLPRFIKTLEGPKMNLTDEERKVVEEAKNVNSLTKEQIKFYYEVLRTLMYNKSGIYNHFEFTHILLKDLSMVDLYKLINEELDELSKILGRYYILKEDSIYIYKILQAYNGIQHDYHKLAEEKPTPNYIDVKDAIAFFYNGADSTGKTGIEKAKMILQDNRFNSLNDWDRKVIKYVATYESCSKEQLIKINEIYEQFGFGKCDPVNIPLSFRPKEVQDVLKDIELIEGSDKFDTLTDLQKSIIDTVKKTKKCSSKQRYHINQAKIVLGL